jgi:hypothetical protein
MSILGIGTDKKQVELKAKAKPTGGVYQTIVGTIVDNTKKLKQKTSIGVEFDFSIISVKADSKIYDLIITDSNMPIAIEGNFPIDRVGSFEVQVKTIVDRVKRKDALGKVKSAKRNIVKYIYRKHEIYSV